MTVQLSANWKCSFVEQADSGVWNEPGGRKATTGMNTVLQRRIQPYTYFLHMLCLTLSCVTLKNTQIPFHQIKPPYLLEVFSTP